MVIIMKEMVYTSERKVELLHKDELMGFEYFIVSYGTHPCCYIKIPEDHELFGKDYDEISDMGCVSCHGGLTYSESKLLDEEEGWYIGWDYAHLGDYSPILEPTGERYSLSRLIAEVIEVVVDLYEES